MAEGGLCFNFFGQLHGPVESSPLVDKVIKRFTHCRLGDAIGRATELKVSRSRQRFAVDCFNLEDCLSRICLAPGFGAVHAGARNANDTPQGLSQQTHDSFGLQFGYRNRFRLSVRAGLLRGNQRESNQQHGRKQQLVSSVHHPVSSLVPDAPPRRELRAASVSAGEEISVRLLKYNSITAGVRTEAS